ncbi:MAG: hypothetical protein HY509_04760 [Acidobacteria bacterium]|nr:hypothetical protein [Acidobacteriota bacterium]
MTRGNRDEFLKSTRDALAARAGMRCSNPSCRRATAKGDPTDPENWIDLGIAAHITAASAGGPRYDPSLTPEMRRSASNGIWLCHHCAKEVDSTASTYSAETLRTWKQQAEACTARDAAATLDEIAGLIADIESARSLIAQYIEERQSTDPTYAFPAHGREEWAKYTEAIVRHGTETQSGWDARVAPRVSDVLTRAAGLLGDKHSAMVEAERVAFYARTNRLGMKDMAERLDEIRSHLLLR